MTRTTAREIAIHLSYELGFSSLTASELMDLRLDPEVFRTLEEEDEIYREMPNEKQLKYIRQLVTGVGEHSAELDSYIGKYAVGWSFSRISRVASAIMRVAMYEILYMPEIPTGAAINEAVEIAKKYEEPEVVSFINGILGTFVRRECNESGPEENRE
ncbi:transcription antitermination factor NusB [Papillibacter cinnamivorans]|uniref:Transcription antitermination protein NusB n=1 Tax=Papillibacter cinnamivorans DSM 12816 TaxID=1122930 RepID=A0A1W2CJV9_9FIRM|nr:transcription antitermination factor NusB [Papillibacter cinnamivorans]SMC85525.1 NusB antitermination factor [Papillibacter cinnamivorans DSM 12816]